MADSKKLSKFINAQIEAKGLQDKKHSISPYLLRDIIGDELWRTLKIYNSLSKKQQMYVRGVLEKLRRYEF